MERRPNNWIEKDRSMRKKPLELYVNSWHVPDLSKKIKRYTQPNGILFLRSLQGTRK